MRQIISLRLGLKTRRPEPGAAAPVAEISLPVNQILSPAGTQVDLGDTRPQVIALSPDGKLLATGGKDQNVMLWSAEPRSSRDTLPDDKDTRPIFSPDGTMVLTVVKTGTGGHFTLWKMDSRTSMTEFPEDEKVTGFSPDGSRIISWDPMLQG